MCVSCKSMHGRGACRVGAVSSCAPSPGGAARALGQSGRLCAGHKPPAFVAGPGCAGGCLVPEQHLLSGARGSTDTVQGLWTRLIGASGRYNFGSMIEGYFLYPPIKFCLLLYLIGVCMRLSSQCLTAATCNPMQRVAEDFMAEPDPDNPGGFLAPSGGFKGLIHNG